MRLLNVLICFVVTRATRKWIQAKGYDCGGENVTASGGLEDGTPHIWGPPGPTRILTCQKKCTASKGCTAFVWLGKPRKCLWRKNVSPSTVTKKKGHYCFTGTHPYGKYLSLWYIYVCLSILKFFCHLREFVKKKHKKTKRQNDIPLKLF